jgi:hypothetical protein
VDQTSISTVARKTVLAWAESVSVKPNLDQRLAEIANRLDTVCKLLSQH